MAELNGTYLVGTAIKLLTGKCSGFVIKTEMKEFPGLVGMQRVAQGAYVMRIAKKSNGSIGHEVGMNCATCGDRVVCRIFPTTSGLEKHVDLPWQCPNNTALVARARRLFL